MHRLFYSTATLTALMLWVWAETVYVALAALVFASVAEYVIHRLVMHTKWWLSVSAYVAHHVEHHGMYRSDESYHADTERHRDPNHEHIDMAWWHRFIIVIPAWIVFLTGFWLLLWVTGWEVSSQTWKLVLWESLIIFWVNYEVYDYFHHCMHTPKGRWFETTELYAFLNRHHNIHHAHPKECNWNTIVVFADIMFLTWRTTYKRERTQPGAPVPEIGSGN